VRAGKECNFGMRRSYSSCVSVEHEEEKKERSTRTRDDGRFLRSECGSEAIPTITASMIHVADLSSLTRSGAHHDIMCWLLTIVHDSSHSAGF
jgi:hypothetical protein